MVIRLDLNSEDTLYSQLINQIKYGIAKGYLHPGEDLPSVRALASELGINMHTISKAYNILKDEGIIVINRSSGVKVNESVVSVKNDRYESIFKKKMLELISESICNGISKEEFIDTVNSTYTELGGN